MRIMSGPILVAGVVAAACLYVATYFYVQAKRQEAFNSVNEGDTATSVVARFGTPSVREGPEKLFTRYAPSRSQSPWLERLWFENSLALNLSPWSLSLR